jgi:cyclic-di-AMP phosphodiesterase PgpH
VNGLDPSDSHTPQAAPQTRKLWLLALIATLTTLGLTAALLLRFWIGGDLTLTAGDVALRDIRAPGRTQYISALETKRQQDLAEASVAPIFTPLDAQVARQQLVAARGALDQILTIRQSQAELGDRIGALLEIKPLALDEPAARLLIASNDTEWLNVDRQVISVLDEAMRVPIRPDNIDQARKSLRQQISLSLNPQQAALVETIVATMLVPNTNFDEAATNAAREAARDNVKQVERVYEANQIIVRSGQIVGPADIEAMEMMNIRRPNLAWTDIAIAILMSAISVFTLGLTLLRRPDAVLATPLRTVLLSAVTLTLGVFFARWLLPGHGLTPYLAPIAAIGIAVSAWSGTLAGVLAASIAGMLTGMALDNPLEMAVIHGLGGIVAGMVLGRATRMSDFIRAGLVSGAVQLALVASFNLLMAQRPGELPQLISFLVASFASGLISSGLALAAIYLSGLIFDITSVVHLNDLARPSHPLIQKLLLQAPGTYHHSLMVGNLAEQAAERIGADSLLARVGAYYHDIGKLEHPNYFIENQMEGVNIHDTLDPKTSAAMLHSHVRDGLALAKKYRLPGKIRDFIAQHHGTTRTNYQYQRALRAQDSDLPLDDAPFRYPGPRPRSRETALMMLADACEATVRACKCETLEAMDAVVRRTIAERLADHQLDDSNLTLRELEQIRQSFMETLRGVYHPRVEYPGGRDEPVKIPAPDGNTNTLDTQSITANA